MKLAKQILDSRIALSLLSLFLTIIISSAFYLVVNYKFYYTGAEWQIVSEAKIVRNAIYAYLASGADTDGSTDRKYISNLIANDKSYIEVECLKNNQIIWTEKNSKAKYLDGTRTVVPYEDNISNKDRIYHIKIQRGNRPKWYVQLYRAWTFSAADFFRDKDAYAKGRLDYRSWPLVFSVILSALFVTFALLFYRKMHLDGIRQINDLHSQLQMLKDHRNQLVAERDSMSGSLDKLDLVSKKLYSENTKLRETNDKARLLYEKYKELISQSNDDSEKYKILSTKYEYDSKFMTMMDEEIGNLRSQLEIRDNEIKSKDLDIAQKEALITDLQKSLALPPLSAEDTSAQKKIEKALKTVLPHVLFIKPALKQIVNDAPLSEVTTLEIMSQLLVALENSYGYEELCKRFTCENMSETKGVYRLKKGDCRVYFFFIPKNIKTSNAYKNANVEVVEVLYKKKKDGISDYVKNCKPSWS